MSLPKFDNYQEEGPTDDGYESLQDFFLSWTIRCSPDKYRKENKKLQEYARRIVFIMIFGNNNSDRYSIENNFPDEFRVKEVKTKRQFKGIDLLAEVTTTYKGEENKHLLNIENKVYSSLQPNQLKRYKSIIEEWYSGYEISNLFITCDDCRKDYESEKIKCQENNYKYLTINCLFVLSEMDKLDKTGNELFDEYWFVD